MKVKQIKELINNEEILSFSFLYKRSHGKFLEKLIDNRMVLSVDIEAIFPTTYEKKPYYIVTIKKDTKIK